MSELAHDTTAWIIRAAPQSRLAKAFADNDLVALGWPDLTGDLTGRSASEIATDLSRSTHITTPAFDAAELIAFRDDVAVGDLVVTPDATVREFIVGAVAGPYEFWPSTPAVDRDGPYRHVRSMEWWGRDSRDVLPDHLARALSWRRTIRRLDLGNEWAAIANRLRTAPRSAKERGRLGRARAAGSPALKTPPPPAVRTITCSHCGEQRPASQFASGSQWCNDCQADFGAE